MRTIILILLALSFMLRVHAQDSDAYTLRTPDADEYVALIQDLASQQASPGSEWPLLRAMSTVLFQQYGADVSYELLSQLYEAVRVAEDYISDRGAWGDAIVLAWLRENQPDLSSVSELAFDDFTIFVTPRDFDADGRDEYLLDVYKGALVDRLDCRSDDAELVDYQIVRQIGGEYTLIDHPVPWTRETVGGFSNVGELKIIEVGFEDLNADGVPEWLVMTGGETGGGPLAGSLNAGELRVLTYRDDMMVDLTRNPMPGAYPRFFTTYFEDGGGCRGPVPADVTWEFENIDSDAPLEILQHQTYLDNWYCKKVTTTVLDWNTDANQYLIAEITNELDDSTRNCAQRQAEEAMWAGELEAAIRLYEAALDLPFYRPQAYADDETLPGYLQLELTPLDQYMRARLALAYIITGQPTMAERLLEQLSGETFVERVYSEFVTLLSEAVDAPLQACLAAYDFFTLNYPQQVLGTIREQYYGDFVRYIPENIGCDASSMIDRFLAQYVFGPEESPQDAFRALNLPIYESLAADFNDDGWDEWLIWLDSLMLSFSFVPTADGYMISRPRIDPYHLSDGVQTFALPGDAGPAVAYFYTEYRRRNAPWLFVYDPYIGGTGGNIGRCDNLEEILSYQLVMWRLDENNAWSTVFDGTVCFDSLDDVLPDGDGSIALRGGTWSYDMDGDGEPESEELIFYWNAQGMTYEVAEAIVPPMQTATPENLYEGPTNFQLETLFNSGDYATIIDRTDGIPPVTSDGIYYPNSRYFRALAMMALDRPDEALAEFIALYEAELGSGWSLLAALYLAPIA